VWGAGTETGLSAAKPTTTPSIIGMNGHISSLKRLIFTEAKNDAKTEVKNEIKKEESQESQEIAL
jgi:hypothetical protein